MSTNPYTTNTTGTTGTTGTTTTGTTTGGSAGAHAGEGLKGVFAKGHVSAKRQKPHLFSPHIIISPHLRPPKPHPSYIPHPDFPSNNNTQH